MAVLRIGDVDISIPEVWDDELYFEAEDETWWHRFEGAEGGNMPGVRKDDLDGKPGDTIRTRIYLKLQQTPILDDAPLEGNEEKLRSREMTFGVRRRKGGVREDELAQIQSLDDLKAIAMGQMVTWLAGILDDLVWAEVTGNGTTTMPDGNKWAMGTASSRATVADTDAGGRITLASLSDLKAYSQVTLKMPPFRGGPGNAFYGFAGHPFALLDLKQSSSWQEAQRDALPRGWDNPLFTGPDYVGMWDGILMYGVSDRVPSSTNGSVIVADNVFFGSNLYARGYQQRPTWRTQLFDYGTEWGLGVVVVHGQKLITFDLTDAGGAADSAKTAIGGVVAYSAAEPPSQP